MAIQKKIVGRLPLFFGEYDSSTTYKSMNRVTYYGSEFQVGLGPAPDYEYITVNGVPPCSKPVPVVDPGDGKKRWTFTVNDPWIVVSDLTDAYMIVDDVNERFDDIERNTLSLTMSVKVNGQSINPSSYTFSKKSAENITFTVKLGKDLQPSVVNIMHGSTKINHGNEMTASYGDKLTDSSNVFSSEVRYNNTTFTTNVTLSSRYSVYTLFAPKTANIPDFTNKFNEETARTSAAGTYTFTNNPEKGGAGYCPYLLVPYDVVQPRAFSMGGAPVDYKKTSITLSIDGTNVSYTAYRLGSDNGYPVDPVTVLTIVATV
jgi:hypothetical protein